MNVIEDIKNRFESFFNNDSENVAKVGRYGRHALKKRKTDNWRYQYEPGKELPSTENMSESQKYDIYSNIVDKHGSAKAKKQLDHGEKVALSLRVETNPDVNGGKGQYDDRIVLLWKDANGVGHIREYTANVDPSGQYEDGGPYCRKPDGEDYAEEDGHGDGRDDLGRLVEGTYTYNKSSYLGEAAFFSTSDQLVERDVDHNGVFDDDAMCPRGNYDMYIHIGGENNTYSAGCFTMPPEEHSEFFETIGNQEKLTNVVVNMKVAQWHS